LLDRNFTASLSKPTNFFEFIGLIISGILQGNQLTVKAIVISPRPYQLPSNLASTGISRITNTFGRVTSIVTVWDISPAVIECFAFPDLLVCAIVDSGTLTYCRILVRCNYLRATKPPSRFLGFHLIVKLKHVHA